MSAFNFLGRGSFEPEKHRFAFLQPIFYLYVPLQKPYKDYLILNLFYCNTFVVLCTLVAKNGALLVAKNCALLFPDYICP